MSSKAMIDILFANDPCLAIEKFPDLIDDGQVGVAVVKYPNLAAKHLHKRMSSNQISMLCNRYPELVMSVFSDRMTDDDVMACSFSAPWLVVEKQLLHRVPLHHAKKLLMENAAAAITCGIDLNDDMFNALAWKCLGAASKHHPARMSDDMVDALIEKDPRTAIENIKDRLTKDQYQKCISSLPDLLAKELAATILSNSAKA